GTGLNESGGWKNWPKRRELLAVGTNRHVLSTRPVRVSEIGFSCQKVFTMTPFVATEPGTPHSSRPLRKTAGKGECGASISRLELHYKRKRCLTPQPVEILKGKPTRERTQGK